MPLLRQSLELTRQRAEPPLLQLAFAKWVLKSILDICLYRSMSKCVVFLKCCAVHLKNASACPIELCSCRTMSVAILLEPYVLIRFSVYFCNKASKFPSSEIAADVEVVRGSSRYGHYEEPGHLRLKSTGQGIEKWYP